MAWPVLFFSYETSFFTNMLYFYAILQNLIKTEQTIEKTPNFAQVIISTKTTHTQNYNVLG